MKKSANLKKRLEELRDEPEATVEVVLQLDAALYRTLKKLAAQERLSLEAYIARILSTSIETGAGEEAGEGGIEIFA